MSRRTFFYSATAGALKVLRAVRSQALDAGVTSVSNFREVETEKNEMWWYPYGSLDGHYSIEITYAVDAGMAGSPFRIGVQKAESNVAQVTLNGRIESTNGQFATRRVVGTFRVAPDDQHIFQPAGR